MSTFRRLVVTAALFVIAFFGWVAPASAHSDLQSIAPADGSSVEVAPPDVVLTFTANVIGDFTQVEVRGPDGALTLAAPSSQDNVVTQPLPSGLPAGSYAVVYRIVSADSHPISGQSTFTVTVGVPAEPATSQSSSPAITETSSGAAPAESTESAPSVIAPAPVPSSDSGSIPWPWIIGATLVASLVAAVVMARSKRRS